MQLLIFDAAGRAAVGWVDNKKFWRRKKKSASRLDWKVVTSGSVRRYLSPPKILHVVVGEVAGAS
jgi:hypothetical protein